MSKKTSTPKADSADTSGAFRWTPELDLKLLHLISIPKPGIGAKEHAELAAALGVPTAGGVRNRVSKLRGDTKRTYEEVGWSEADKNFGPATPKKNAGTPKKGSKKGSENGKKTPSSTGKKRGAKEMETDANDNDDDDGFSNFNLFGSKKMKKDEDEEESKEIKEEQVETQF